MTTVQHIHIKSASKSIIFIKALSQQCGGQLKIYIQHRQIKFPVSTNPQYTLTEQTYTDKLAEESFAWGR